mgnify:CR=1 FL=1
MAGELSTSTIAKVIGYSVDPFEYKDGFAIMNVRLFVPFKHHKSFTPEAVVECIHNLFEDAEDDD